MADHERKKPVWWKVLLWCLVLALAAVLLTAGYRYLDNQGYLEVFKSTQALQDYVEGFGVWAPLAFILLQLIQVIVAPIPGNVTTLAGGALFGFLPAFLYSTLAVFLGSLAAFGIGRYCGRPLVNRLAPKEVVDKYLGVLAEKQRLTLSLMFLLPFFPDDVLCLLAGLTGYSWSFFSGMVLLTRPWGLLFSALVGSGELHLPLWGWVLLVLVAAALLVLSSRYGSRIEDWLLRKIRRKRKPGAAPDGRAD